MRLDIYISETKDVSRSKAQEMIKKELIKINGKTIKKNGFEISGEENFEIKDFPIKPFSAKPKKMKLDIIFENEDFLVLNKEKGVQVYPGNEGDMENTLLSGFRDYFFAGENQISIEKICFVHRLDKDTSGAIIIAKNTKTHELLAKEFRERRVFKVYLALIKGKPNSNGIIDSPIKRSSEDKTKMTVGISGKNSQSIFDIIKYFKEIDSTLIKVRIITGRTHQIRTHFSSIGFPLIGDKKYGNEKINAFFEEKYGINSQFLHSYFLKIKYNGEFMSFLANPKQDFEKLGISDFIPTKENIENFD